MRKFERDQMVEEDSAEPGIRISDVSRAVMVWVTMNGPRQITVAEAAQAFNTSEEIILAAIEYNPWLFQFGDFIEVE